MRRSISLLRFGGGLASLLAFSTTAAAQVYTPDIVLSEMNNIFAFGDSYTATGYNPRNGLLTNLTTLGNSSANGFNWLQYLALRNPNNRTAEAYFDFAQFGATVNSSLIKAENATVPDFGQQVSTWSSYFLPPPARVNWTSADSLFALWFGINDIGFSSLTALNDPKPNATTTATTTTFEEIFPAIGASYNAVIASLYARGARNFLILTIPPTDRSPLITSLGPSTIAEVQRNIAKYNTMLGAYPAQFRALYPGAKVVLFDTWSVFTEMLDNPLEYGFTDVNSTCAAYVSVTTDPLVDLPTLCPWPSYQMFWANGYHPVWRVHENLATVLQAYLTPAVISDPSNLTLTDVPLSTARVTSARSVVVLSTESTAATASASTVPIMTGQGTEGSPTASPTATPITSSTDRDRQSAISVIAGRPTGMGAIGSAAKEMRMGRMGLLPRVGMAMGMVGCALA